MLKKDNEGNSVLITGTSTGIGRAAAFYFAKQGWNVIATMRNPEKETELNVQPSIFVTQLDVTDDRSIHAAIGLGIARFGHIDVVVNNAGYGQIGLFEAVSNEKIRAQFDTNVFGLMNVTRSVLPHFRSRKSGIVINVSSTLGIVPMPMSSVYTSSKFAVEGFSEALAYELDSQGIKVKIVEPGGIDTSFGQRSKEEYAHDPQLTDYQAFMKRGSEEQYSYYNNFSAEDVASVIYTAATDGTQQLRYIAGPDAEKLIKIKNYGRSDQEYVKAIRDIFAPDAFNS